jgi:hypothetical protein
MTRTPWIERAEVVARWCSCVRDDEGELEHAFIHRTDEHGRQWVTRVPLHNPKCALHGNDAQPSPF